MQHLLGDGECIQRLSR